MADVIIITVIIVLCIAICFFIWKRKKDGKSLTSTCNGDCSGCSGSCKK